MKTLTDYPTPKTDVLRSRIPEPRAIQDMIASHSDLERRLAACREALNRLMESCECIDCADFMPASMPDAYENAKKALSLTSPLANLNPKRDPQ